jgi:cobalt-zinc-cadmium efflux system membrane fusion protein
VTIPRRTTWIAALMAAVVILGGLALSPLLRPRLVEAIEAQLGPAPSKADDATPAPKADDTWDGQVELKPEQIQALGLTTTPVVTQSEPTTLEITAATAFDPSTLTRVRPRFESVARTIHVQIGQKVKAGDPVVSLFSTDLAEAKGRLEEKRAQWEHDKAQLARIEPLFREKAVSERTYFDAVTDERKSGLEFRVAHDNLVVFGLTEPEILAVANEDSTQKASLTLRSPVDGLVIERNGSEGSLYDTSDVLLVIAPADRYWVVGNVYESDLPKVRVGQAFTIRFPYSDDVIAANVEQVDTRVDPATRTVQIRTTVPDPEGRFKADMLVYGTLSVPPRPGATVVPREAVIVSDRDVAVFVEEPQEPGVFERRTVAIEEEYADHVVLRRGVEPGEAVVVKASLILSQYYDDSAQAAGKSRP